MPDRLEPVLIETARHTQLVATPEEVRMTFNLSDDEAIAVWGWEMGFEAAFPPVDQQVNMAIMLDPDVQITAMIDAYDNDDTFARFSYAHDIQTSGAAGGQPTARQFFPVPILHVDDITWVVSTNNVGLITFCAVYFQNTRLSDTELVRQIVRRR